MSMDRFISSDGEDAMIRDTKEDESVSELAPRVRVGREVRQRTSVKLFAIRVDLVNDKLRVKEVGRVHGA